MEIANIIIYTLGILAILSGIALGLKRGYEFLSKGMKEKRAIRKQMERARFVKDVRAEVKRYLEELAK